MHLAYSALNQTKQKTKQTALAGNPAIAGRYQAYLATCHKYAQEIAAIQQYLPGWQPAFN